MSSTSRPQLRLLTTPPSPTTYTHLLYGDASKRDSFLTIDKHGSSTSSSSSSTHSTSSTSHHSSASSHTNASVHSSPITLKYADDHYPLITTLNSPPSVSHTHPSVQLAHHVAQLNNSLIRALSTSYNHCLTIHPCNDTATDFLLFNSFIASTIQQHLASTTTLFATLKKLVPSTNSPTPQHHFTEALTLFTKYTTSTTSPEYSGLTLRHIIDTFTPPLLQHFQSQIRTIISTTNISLIHLPTLKAITTDFINLEYDLHISTPLFLGSQDRNFTIDRMTSSFPAKSRTFKVVRTWYARKHSGAWRFSGSDFEGRRRRLG